MANIKSKEKNIKRIKNRTQRNRAMKSKMKTNLKKAINVLSSPTDDSNLKSFISKAQQSIDKSVSKGAIHWKNGARKVTNLFKLVNKKQNLKSK